MSEDEMYDTYDGVDDDSAEESGNESQLDMDDEEDMDYEYSTQEVDYDDIHSSNRSNSKLTRQRSFEVLDKGELQSESKKLIKEVMDVLSINSESAVSILLRHLKWNKEKLIEKYMDNSDKLCADAGIPSLKLEKPVSTTMQKFSCLICLDELPPSQTFALSCDHRYCLPCWKGYLECKIGEGPECILATCPAPKCKVRVHEEAVKKLVETPTYEKYANFILKSFVDDNPQVKWCPAPGCIYSVRCDRKERKEAVTCKCGFQYCFNCNDFEIGDHMPCPCSQVDRWLQKASDESENVTWMLANTKKCPECRSPIEKNGGCMHMTCRKNAGGCGFEFCWLCRGAWSDHGSATGGYYNCNKYDKSKAKEDDEKAADAKTELEAYMFYYHRYESHKNAMKIADEQRRNAHQKEQQILSKFDVRSADTKFLMEATEQLLRNRRVLQYSYVYGYYLDKKSQERNLFEYLQEDLEKHTNQLSTYYELSIDKLEDYQAFIKWKEQVTNYTRITKKFLDNFVEGVAGGLTTQLSSKNN
ncbi:ariadne-like ubiquitin ligase [Cavenderia fasciculata]|uniref:RBR-type E3 ubiquitin transferase n=1 Tax=Cavenderia fasciculata TaxID=261658 RepID=F4PV18_CACFS|nr:ariadne-like ubiquitin ligase [Cavenderia fasciculata]EGG21134.1 ariadne-like ubiquitin ligase [Cavenderia fasciculata]|eukprot:XP_004358984.1 ariadne-like ubiquitin ligase [Cavenderia fasciculata]